MEEQKHIKGINDYHKLYDILMNDYDNEPVFINNGLDHFERDYKEFDINIFLSVAKDRLWGAFYKLKDIPGNEWMQGVADAFPWEDYPIALSDLVSEPEKINKNLPKYFNNIALVLLEYHQAGVRKSPIRLSKTLQIIREVYPRSIEKRNKSNSDLYDLPTDIFNENYKNTVKLLFLDYLSTQDLFPGLVNRKNLRETIGFILEIPPDSMKKPLGKVDDYTRAKVEKMKGTSSSQKARALELVQILMKKLQSETNLSSSNKISWISDTIDKRINELK